MTYSIPIEPSCYIFTHIEDEPDEFRIRFWPIFKAIDKFFELNDLKFPISNELYDSVSHLWPFQAGIRLPNRQEPSTLVLKFIEKRMQRPVFEYKGLEEAFATESFHKPKGAYADEYVWIAWMDLLAQIIRNFEHHHSDHAPIILTCDKWSSFCDPPVVVFKIFDELEVILRGYRVGTGEWPPGLIAPESFLSLYSRARPGIPPFCEEKSGHLPPIKIKRSLMRTATKLNWLVERVATTFRMDTGTDPCKLQLTPDPGEIDFRISDGNVLFKGVFKTIAKTSEEQKLSLIMLTREFRVQCEQEGFVIN